MNKLQRKFKNYLSTLQDAASGQFDLRDNYKLYQKVHRFYTQEGVSFTGDTTTDYNLVINYLSEDLTY